MAALTPSGKLPLPGEAGGAITMKVSVFDPPDPPPDELHAVITKTAIASAAMRSFFTGANPFSCCWWPDAAGAKVRRPSQVELFDPGAVAPDLVGRAFEPDSAAAHEIGAVDDIEGDRHVLLDEQDGGAPFGGGSQCGEQAPDDDGSEPERELVRQDHLGPGRPYPGPRH